MEIFHGSITGILLGKWDTSADSGKAYGFSTAGAVYPHIKIFKKSMVDSILGFAGQALLSSFFIFHGFLTMRFFHAHELGYGTLPCPCWMIQWMNQLCGVVCSAKTPPRTQVGNIAFNFDPRSTTWGCKITSSAVFHLISGWHYDFWFAIGTSNSSGTTYPHRGSLHSHHSSATEGFGRSMIYPDISWWKKTLLPPICNWFHPHLFVADASIP